MYAPLKKNPAYRPNSNNWTLIGYAQSPTCTCTSPTVAQVLQPRFNPEFIHIIKCEVKFVDFNLATASLKSFSLTSLVFLKINLHANICAAEFFLI